MGKPAKVFFTMVHAPYGIKRVGSAYFKRETAKSWVKFVRSAWHGMRVTVAECPLFYDAEGNLTAESIARLDSEFNIEAGRK
jgi:hypothetical protein